MKLRIKRDSLRLRLTQAEFDRLLREGVLEDSTFLGGAAPFRYRLILDAETDDDVRTVKTDDGIDVRAPRSRAETMARPDQVGFSAVETHPDGRQTTVLIEKDFACLKPRADDDDLDAFPNPGAAADRAK